MVTTRFRPRLVAENPFRRLGYDLTYKLRQDRPELIRVQYTATLSCPVHDVVSVHDVSFLEHPEYFSSCRSAHYRWTVNRIVKYSDHVLTHRAFPNR